MRTHTVRRSRTPSGRKNTLAVLLFYSLVALSSASTVTYQYDELGRLRKVTYDNGTVIDYAVDPANNRVSVATTLVPGNLQFSAATATVAENGISITLTVTRTSGSLGTASVHYSSTSGTAISGNDFTAVSGVLSWGPADTSNRTITVNIADDTSAENAESFSVTLDSPSGAVLGAPVTATVTIPANDYPSVPANVRTTPAGSCTGCSSHTVLWNASTGPVNHYRLQIVDSTNPGPPQISTTTATTTSKTFSATRIRRQYSVRACATADENFCSALSSPPINFVACSPTMGCP